jgi:AraC-type transcriptional regulator N-terminus
VSPMSPECGVLPLSQEGQSLGVVAQGGKQVLIGSESIDCGPGQSMLTTIDLPVVSHMTRASAREPFLGMMLTLNVRSVVQVASELDVPRQRRDDAYRAISFEPLDAVLQMHWSGS